MQQLFPLPAEGQKHDLKPLAGKAMASVSFSPPREGNIWSMAFWRSGEGTDVWKLRVDENGIYLLGIASGGGYAEIEPSLLLIPREVSEGKGWSSSGRLKIPLQANPADIPDLRFLVEGSPNPVEVPAMGGTRSARSIDLTTTVKEHGGLRSGSSTTRLWFSPGIGLVRVERWKGHADEKTAIRTWEVESTK